MDKYKENILALIWPDSTFKTLVGDGGPPIPYIDDYHHRDTADDLDYPPFILPFFADFSGPELRGLIVHPFSPKRSVSIVNYNLESAKVVEIARTTSQYVTEMR